MPAAAALIRPLAWERPNAVGAAALKIKIFKFKKKKKRESEEKKRELTISLNDQGGLVETIES